MSITSSTARAANAAGTANTAASPQWDIGSDSLPREQIQGSVRYLSGGIGLREAIAIKHAMHQFPLTLEFRARAKGKERLLSAVPVTIRVLGGQVVLKSTSAGPFLLARLLPGGYEVTAEACGTKQRRVVQIRANGGEHLVFEWNIA